MATESQVDYNFLNLRCPTIYQELKDGTKVYHPVQLYFSQNACSHKKRKNRDFLFNYDQISGNFEKIIKTWYSFDNSMAPIIQHLIQSIQPNDSFSKSDFLIVVQAVEGFHTRFRDKRKKYLIDRLKSIKEEFLFVDRIKNIKLDLKITVDSRHYYSHFFHKSQKEHVADGLELYNITKMLKALLICCILKESGFEDPTIKSIIDDNEQILQI